MERQRNNVQTKEKEESPEKELNEIEASKSIDTEFKVMAMRMLKEHSENYISMRNDIQTINKNQLGMNAISDMKNKPLGIKSRLDEA